ncbi:sulfite exporter TauE/SafE family protein [Thalassotalea euphylliae]|uniref:Probable membrane transporter protein n=1 Tax=Thalassotalea euphylliae TaxID=1655234 RepID=A0A3E0U5Q4_9GAMM|nr:sulfite exporter TauE/SafE family protein [Thalassotalea euphylliae]REL31893.1 sulfite exporter TauE/SafE family protein [Thalassotalea euphylliae]
MTTQTRSPLFSAKFLLPFSLLWVVLVGLSGFPVSQLSEYISYSLLGVLGAIFASSTGAGGGVIFIPMFNHLSFSEIQSIATSFAIQCFGMTAGALTWYHHYHKEKRDLVLWQGFKRIIAVTSIAAIAGIWSIYGANVNSPASLHQSFGWFSLALGLFIVTTVYLLKPKRESSKLQYFDYLAIIAIGYFGGAITAWLSVGVGEVLAIYLILRRFDVTMAVAAAVVVSAFTVWSAIWQHTLISFNVYWQVVIFAGPGAVIGGILAKSLVTYLSARKLKLFFAFWLIAIGLTETL